jgi:hypothetical protein
MNMLELQNFVRLIESALAIIKLNLLVRQITPTVRLYLYLIFTPVVAVLGSLRLAVPVRKLRAES